MTKDQIASTESLPFPRTPSASTAGRTMQESIYKRRVEPRRLAEDAPNILIGPDRRRRPRPADHLRGRSRRSARWTASSARASPITGFIPPPCARRHARQYLPGAIITELATDRSQNSPTTGTATPGRCRKAARSPPRSSRTTATAPAPSASGTTRRRWRPRRQAHLRTGPRTWGSNISTDSSLARPPSTTKSGAQHPASCRPVHPRGGVSFERRPGE